MTIQEELRNRSNCRNKLRGVIVTVGGDPEKIPVEDSHWDKDKKLFIALEDGREVPAHLCHLHSPWPVACCEPELRNEWNTNWVR